MAAGNICIHNYHWLKLNLTAATTSGRTKEVTFMNEEVDKLKAWESAMEKCL
jgi:hypothetical protein